MLLNRVDTYLLSCAITTLAKLDCAYPEIVDGSLAIQSNVEKRLSKVGDLIYDQSLVPDHHHIAPMLRRAPPKETFTAVAKRINAKTRSRSIQMRRDSTRAILQEM